jgi:predicted DNA-binding ribbon-helix-helix protein
MPIPGDLTRQRGTRICHRVIRVGNRRTSIRFSEELLSALEEIALREHCNRDEICAMIARTKPRDLSLTRAVNIFVLRYFRDASTEEGHLAVGHGSIYAAGPRNSHM